VLPNDFKKNAGFPDVGHMMEFALNTCTVQSHSQSWPKTNEEKDNLKNSLKRLRVNRLEKGQKTARIQFFDSVFKGINTIIVEYFSKLKTTRQFIYSEILRHTR